MPIQKGPANLGAGSVDSTELSNTLDLSAKTVTYRTIVAGDIASNAITTAKIADANITPAKMANSGAELGMRNKIINGAMVIDQRNSGASLTPVNATSDTADRWRIQASAASKFTVQQMNGLNSSASNYEANSVPAGFTYSIKATSSGTYTPGTSEIFGYYQGIENVNILDLNWGTANALPVTLSFWTKSSLTGVFSGAIQQGPSTRNYPFSFTIFAANTWQYVTITIPGDTVNAWAGNHMYLFFTLSCGATALTTGGAWTSGSGNGYHGVTGTTNLLGTSGATFYLTGVQLEKGSTATPFEYRHYTTELSLCQRYYVKTYNISVVPGTSGEKGGSLFTYKNSNSNFAWNFQFPVQMRTTPSFTTYSHAGTAGKASVSTTDFTVSTNAPINGDRMIMVYGNAAVADDGYVHVVATAEL